MNILNKMERKFGRIAIPNLMFIIVAGMLAVFCTNLLFPQLQLLSYIDLNRAMLFKGQVWRLVTFIFVPTQSSPLWVIFTLYFYYLIGSTLEQQWGMFKFNVYYLVGMLGVILSCLITGYAANTYLNLSLFFAFAVLYPNYQVMLFFILPVKIKYLAFVDALLFIISFVSGGWSVKASIVFSLLNFFLFFGGDFFRDIKANRTYRKNQQNFKNYFDHKDQWR